MPYCALNGNQVVKAQITIPNVGIPTADVILEAEPREALSGLLTLSVGEMTLRMSLARSGSYVGFYTARLVGGYLGWRRQIAPKSYQSSFGLRLAPILTDAAREAGEQVNVTDDRDVQSAYVRRRDKASRVLWDLYPTWWMGLDGVTQIGARAESTVTTGFDVIAYEPFRGRVLVAPSNPESWVPRASFTSVLTPMLTANLIVHNVEQAKLRTEVYYA